MPGFHALGDASVAALTSGDVVTVSVQLDDSVAMTTSFDLGFVYALSDALALTETTSALRTRLATLTETVAFSETLRVILQEVLNDSLDLADEAQLSNRILVTLADTLLITGEATNTLRAMAMITETLALAEVLRLVQIGDITDAVALAETLDASMSAYERLVVEAIFSDEARGLAQVVVVMEDDLALTDAATPTALWLATIEEGLGFSISFVFDGEAYVGLSLNAATKALTSYTNYPFNSMASFNGQTYGASAEGLYRLGGADDAGTAIIWKLRTGLSNFGTSRNKGLDAAYLGFTADGRVGLKCIIVAPTGEKIAYWYELTNQTAENPLAKRLQLGRGLKSVYMGFELSNIDAGDIELDIIELHPIILDGRL